MPEQTFDLRRVLWLMRGQRTIVAACVLVGALSSDDPDAVAFDVVYRDIHRPRSNLRLEVMHQEGPRAAPAMETSPTAALAVSSAVLGPADPAALRLP